LITAPLLKRRKPIEACQLVTINLLEARPQSFSPSTPPQGLARILVTDDRPKVLQLVDRVLGKRYRCDFAANLDQARKKLAAGNFELALCDLEMLGESGFDLAEEISEEHPDTALVLITATDDPELARKAFGLAGHGVHGYLVKPFWPGQLLITAMNALRRRELEVSERSYRLNLEERRRKILDMAPMPIYVKDASYRYVFANGPADELAGRPEGELVGETDEAIMSAEALEQTRADDRRILGDGVTHRAEETIEIGGVERTFQSLKFPLLDEKGEATAVCGISIDVTGQRDALRLRDELAIAQQKAIEELWLSRQETVERLAKAIEMHDVSTGEHVDRIAKVAAYLAAGLGLGADRARLLRVAAPMHDVGKIATPDEVLRKAGPLTPSERAEMQRHTVVGHELLANSKSELLRLAARIALTHHERYDGTGYPRGLAAEEIPLEGRITAVADVFDALLSDRCYRPAMSVQETVAIIEEGRGTQFDPEIVDVLIDGLAEVLRLRA
jgi:PAS domain S-box-containing protein